MASENVPSPVRLSRPTKMSAPTPEASSPGSSTRPIMGPPSPDASISKNAPVMGDPSRVLMAAKLPAAPSTLTPCSGTGAPPGRLGGQHRQAAAERDERHLGANHGAEGQRRQRRADDAGQLDRGRRGMHGETGRRRRPAVTRQVPDRQGGQHSADHQHRQRPPGWRGAVTEPVRQMGEQFLLQVADQGQEAPGGRGDRHAKDRRHDQQPDVGAAAQHGHGVRWSWRGARRPGPTRRARCTLRRRATRSGWCARRGGGIRRGRGARRAPPRRVLSDSHQPIVAPPKVAAAHLRRVTSASLRPSCWSPPARLARPAASPTESGAGRPR